MLVVFGAGGCAKELEWLISDLNSFQEQKIAIDRFVARNVSTAQFLGKPLEEEDVFFSGNTGKNDLSVFIAVGNCFIREKVYKSIISNIPGDIHFPVVIHPSVKRDTREGRLTYGKGNIICASVIIMPDVRMGDFNYISLNSIIGHDSVIGSFVTIFPGVSIAGNVTIHERVLIGAGSIIIENISICKDVIIGAGSVVTRNIEEPGTYVGIPAKRIK